MIKLRMFLCRAFGTLALLSLGVAAPTIALLIHPTRNYRFLFRPSYHHHLSVLQTVLRVSATGLILLLFLSPLVLAFLYGMAWWSGRTGKAAVRGWAIAASIGMLLFSIPQIIAVIGLLYFWSAVHGGRAFVGEIVLLCAITTAIGILGLVAFVPRDAADNPRQSVVQPPRIAGDGTSNLLDILAGAIGFVGYVALMRCWDRWADAHHLPWTHVSLLQIAIGFLLTTALHEVGHTAAGLALGMKVRLFIVGPFQWRIRDGRWKFQFLPTQIFSLGGAASLVPTKPNQSRWDNILMTAGGPVASLLTALVFGALAFSAAGRTSPGFWRFFAFTSSVSLVAFVVNLIPLRPDGMYSDGAQIYQLLKGGPWADLHAVTSIVTSTLVTPLRPRDFDMNAILRAKQSFAIGRHALLLRLWASHYYLDRDDLGNASAALADAEAVFAASPFQIPSGLYTDFVFGDAYLKHDPVTARAWWDRMEAQKPEHMGVDYWLAKSALLWAENRPEDAQEAWRTGYALALQLPAAGAYEFDRSRYGMMRKALNEACVTS